MILAANGDSGFFDGLHDFFFGSGGSAVARNLGIFLAVVFWLAVGYWVFKDARRRIEDPWLVGAATVLGLVPPFVGALIYMLFRPPEYLEDVRERELEIKAMEESLGRGRHQHCPVCRAEIDENFLVCPVCTTRLRQACVSCAPSGWSRSTVPSPRSTTPSMPGNRFTASSSSSSPPGRRLPSFSKARARS